MTNFNSVLKEKHVKFLLPEHKSNSQKFTYIEH